MNRFDVIVIGGGPAGLGAAIEAARLGARTLLLDENSRPGGQLFKQIHKFFGSKEHYAGTRGFNIGEDLLKEAASRHVTFKLNTRVWGVFPDGIVAAYCENQSIKYVGEIIILATGASENVLSFPGNTLPGVITAGAAQTMVNLHRVLPGKRFVVVGSGNVGLIVSYQLKQAGADVLAIAEALPAVSGYAVHAAKVKRGGVKILLGYTIKEALGDESLGQVILWKIDRDMQPIAGTEMTLDADTLCLAVGLNPRVELAKLCGCQIVYSPLLGGMMPWHDENMCTSMGRILVAGDLAGVEEASTALDEGRLAGVAAVQKLGLRNPREIENELAEIKERLYGLRRGPFGEKRQQAKETIINMKLSGESCL